MLDGLVSWPVFAEAYGIVREHEQHLYMRQRGEADGGAHVIGKCLERSAERDDAAVKGHAVHGRTHRVLADAEMDIAVRGAVSLKIGRRFYVSVIRRRQVRRAAYQLRHLLCYRVYHI